MQDLTGTAELLNLFGDPSRVRLMALLESEELSVAELVQVTGLAQSRVSTHLGKLREAGLLRVRRNGASAMYGIARGAPASAEQLWRLVRTGLDDAIISDDARRREQVVSARGRRFPESVAGEMERHYSPGRTWEAFAHGLSALLELGDVLDVGCGDGAVAKLLAPSSRRYVGVDRSDRMIEAARARLASHSNVELVVADMHALPFEPDCFDRVVLFNVLSYAATPPRVLKEAARVLRPGGSVVIQTLNHHAYMETAARYGHAQPGFRAAALRQEIQRAELTVTRCEVVARERKAPHFEVLLALALKPLKQPSRRTRTKTDSRS
jgi:SAM-dependent methyltransferase